MLKGANNPSLVEVLKFLLVGSLDYEIYRLLQPFTFKLLEYFAALDNQLVARLLEKIENDSLTNAYRVLLI